MFHDFVCILVHKTYGITVDVSYYIDTVWGERWDLNPQPPEPQSGALPIELRPPYLIF